MRIAALLALLCAWMILSPLGAEEEELWDLTVHDLDTLILINGDPLIGSIQDIRADGTIVFLAANASGAIGYRPNQYQSYRRRRSAAEVIEQRMRLLLADPENPQAGREIRRTLHWGLERDDPEIREQIKQLAQDAGEKFANDLPLLNDILDLYRIEEDAARIEAITRAGIAQHPNWERGHSALLQVLAQQQRDQALDEAIQRTLTARPNHILANRLAAERALNRGSLSRARDAFRRASASNDPDALLGYASTSLMQRSWNEAERSAQQLLDLPAHVPASRAILGNIRLHQERWQEAHELLQQGLRDPSLLHPELVRISRHNLGLSTLLAGDQEGALELWEANDHPASALAVAALRRRRIEPQHFEAHPTLRTLALEHQASLDLEEGHSDPLVIAALDASQPRQHFFLQLYNLLNERGAINRVRALALNNSRESQRWQLYGHLLAGRLDAAWNLAEALGEEDGYAAVAKVYIRAQEGEQQGAAGLYRRLVEPLARENRGDPRPPASYVAVLASEFDVAAGEYRRYDFDWPDGERLGTGWDYEISPGSGIVLRIENRSMLFERQDGETQAGLARAWCRVRELSFERAILEAEYSEDSNLYSGLEVLNGERSSGIAVSVRPDRRLRWRQMHNHNWQSWRDFNPPLQLAENRHLTLHYRSPGRVYVRDQNNEAVLVGEAFQPSSHLSVSIFSESNQRQGAFFFRAQRLDIGQRQP